MTETTDPESMRYLMLEVGSVTGKRRSRRNADRTDGLVVLS